MLSHPGRREFDPRRSRLRACHTRLLPSRVRRIRSRHSVCSRPPQASLYIPRARYAGGSVQSMDDLLKYRAEFPILDRTTYLISNSLGAMPRGVYDTLHTYADAWANRGIRAWEEGWWE